MCQTCNGSQVVLKSLGFGVMFIPCPECNQRAVNPESDDYHPGQSMAVVAPEQAEPRKYA